MRGSLIEWQLELASFNLFLSLLIIYYIAKGNFLQKSLNTNLYFLFKIRLQF